MLNDGQKYKVDKLQLLEILRKNREKHVAEFKAARAGYVEQSIKALAAELGKARDGQPFTLRIDLVKPKTYAFQYDQVIGMLELTRDEAVDMTLADYRSLVLDKWDWSGQFKSSTERYLGNDGPAEEDE